jgi:cation diffusion facilitator CzcD-associated flavoprotein CzcO
MVPHLAEKASELTVFMRNVTWIAPMFAADEQAAAEDGERPAPAGKHWYTRREKERFRNEPEFHLQYRKDIEGQMGQNFSMFLCGTELNVKAKAMMRE